MTHQEIICRPSGPEDDAAVAALDGSFTTDTVYAVTPFPGSAEGFALRPVPVDPPVRKVFPDDEPDGEEAGDGARRYAAFAGDELCGFVATSYEPWNRRLTVEDIEVAPAYRGRGVGRALMECVAEQARECGAGHVWLEVTNINAPAIRSYLRMGFSFCGMDTTLYSGTASEGEIALFMSRSCS
ncbi:GNAT family N-acetyltransferase [Streptomyces mobaraensis NBRC 13819 = DSM 40847]|uniref:GNAT family N-acetyltransferase n=2 Tax=Streptomyces mobaraensis TaxID=35621 RepID=A0A5N5W068_STRMB|nr:GNAT family N-acetyltransferase [Streptomyces mobaraensis]EME98689.1 streptothricin acetyltransferase [Streptomyces mobaraensis NBRC 13819 = DSM 40847]KAB7834820.1 GNAT family N-acetyltransferase [Streptomyces mobaraensis]QTT72847.1 GNAT family N-acetyltransferase [Streptomyces mobaraensis NBRC 13819 = DSM 40847]